MRKVIRGFVFFLFFLLIVSLSAQENDTWYDASVDFENLYETEDDTVKDAEQITEEDQTAEKKSSAEETVLSPEMRRIEMEIKTSTIPELAAWCRSLGLSESGTRIELSRRLRQYYELPEPRLTANENRKIITIESAQSSEYFKIDVTDEEYARLKGNVSLSLVDNNTTHRINAQEILFNRTRNVLTARGEVFYEQDKGGTIETFRGENITVDLDDWSSVFLDGDSERKLESEGSAYRFSGTVISRTSEDATILNKATITNAHNEEALWSINASKIWLLPGSDFAIFNGILKVGEIPLFYIPFFYYPADEMIFRPVIGYRSREGGFVQTTTYLLGRPKADEADSSSISRILGASNDMEKERQGLFLRSTGKKIVDLDTISLKALIDHYANLGTYFGVDFYLPRTGILNPSTFSAGLGITRTISLTGMGYTPFAPDYDGTSDWNHSNFLSASVPFRYRMLIQGSVSTPIIPMMGGLSWNLPYYSDPYADRDFLNRSETMDWFGMMQQSAEEETTTDNEIGSYQWHINGYLNPPLRSLDPYISRLSISNLSTTMTFKTIRDDVIFLNNREAPGRFFYAPDKYTFYSFSGSVSGTPVSIGGENRNTADLNPPEIEDPFGGIGKPVSPWINEINEQNTDEPLSENKLVPPALNQRFDLPGIGNVGFSVDYQLSPTGTSELQFMNGSWKTYEQVDWSSSQSILSSFAGNSSINFRLNQSRGLFTNVVTLSGSGTWRDYTFLNEEADIFLDNTGEVNENLVTEYRRQQYRQTNYSTSYANNTTVRPFYRDPVFSQTNLQYNFRGTLVRSKRYTDGPGPELTPQLGAWVKEQTKDGEFFPGLNTHRFSSNIAANIMDKLQSVSIGFELPPLDPLISLNSVIRFWISETRMDFRMRKPEESEEWKYEPFHFTEVLRFSNFSSFTFYLILTPEENNEITTITSSLALWNFRASLKALKVQRAEFIPDNPVNPSLGGKWESFGDPDLRINELVFGYKRDLTNRNIIRNRMNFSLNVDSALTFNTLQYTNSNFQFQMGLNFRIIGFMDIRLAATSENAVVWRYFKGLPVMGKMTEMYIDGPQNNLFVDLMDSFNFFNESKRLRSGFKMKRFDLSIIHYLGDWRAEFGVTMYPYMNTANIIPRYEVTSDISFIVQWRPITEIKTNVQYKGEQDRWIRN